MPENIPQDDNNAAHSGQPDSMRRWWLIAAVVLVSVILFVWNSRRLKPAERPYVGEWTHALVSGDIEPMSIVVYPNHTMTMTSAAGSTFECRWRASEDRLEFIESVTPYETGKRIVNGIMSGSPRRQTGRELYRTEWTPEGHIFLYALLHPDSKTEFDESPRVMWTPATQDEP